MQTEPLFAKVLIANRGEIACRVIRTCRRLGVRTVAVYSDADAHALHVREADEAYPIGGSRPAESYLLQEKLIEVARLSGANAIHPGYGFLSENAQFARRVREAGITFIGPDPESVERMGSKADAKALMSAAGVQVVPGYHGVQQEAAFLLERAVEVGFPLMIKAAAGGGGKGMRVVHSVDDFGQALESTQRESMNAFGDQRMILERFVQGPKHIEFQVFGDRHGRVVHLNERECSAQRRYQKIIEETPSPLLTPELRAAMGAAAVAAAKAVNYVGAGTVEFIVGADLQFYFMEMNTRLQVEHPVTEEVLGLDLVELQLRVAAGLRLPEIPAPCGHAFEVRLYAEDPENGFLPGSGRLSALLLPSAGATPIGGRVRIDSGVSAGDTVSIFYDPMIAKLIVWGEDRSHALSVLRYALSRTEVIGPKSNVAFLEALVRHPAIINGSITTNYLDQHLNEVLPAEQALDRDKLLASASVLLLEEETFAIKGPWGRADAFRLGHPGKRALAIGYRGQRLPLSAHGQRGCYTIDLSDASAQIDDAQLASNVLTLKIDGRALRFGVHQHASGVLIHDGIERAYFQRLSAYLFEPIASAASGNTLKSPMPGRIVAIKANSGDTVALGQEILVMEAMKMEMTLRAPRAGVVTELSVAVGDFVESDCLLARVE